MRARYHSAHYKGRKERVDRQRERMVPHGTSTMSDEEFWGRVHETAALQDEQRQGRASGVLHGAFPHKATNTQMARY